LAPQRSSPNGCRGPVVERVKGLDQITGRRLTRKRAATTSRNTAKLISSVRFGSLYAKRAPSGATQLESEATSTTPIADTNPNDNGGNWAKCGKPART